MKLFHDKETEDAIIGTLLINNDVYPRIKNYLDTEDFFDANNKTFFEICKKLWSEGSDINVKSVWNEVYLQGYRGVTINESDFKEYVYKQVEPSTAVDFSKQIAEFSGLRLIQKELSDLMGSIANGEKKLVSYTEVISQLISKISAKGQIKEMKTGEDLFNSLIKLLDSERTKYKLTGMSWIDERIFDLAPGDLTIIAARPSVGKTALALQSVLSNIRNGMRPGFVSMEMEASKLMLRMLSNILNVDGTILRDLPKAQFLENPDYVQQAGFLSNKLVIDDNGPFTNETIQQKIRRMHYDYQCDLIYIDYLGLIGASGHLMSQPRNQQIGRISNMLKGLSSEVKLPFIVNSQLNRETIKQGGRPHLANLRESGDVEQDAALVVFIYADMEKLMRLGINDASLDQYLDDTSEIPVKIEVGKQRNGPLLIRDVKFFKKYGRFEDARIVQASSAIEEVDDIPFA